jgi:hypothetical protein
MAITETFALITLSLIELLRRDSKIRKRSGLNTVTAQPKRKRSGLN